MESLIEFTDAVITTAEEEALYFPPLPELSKGKRYDPDEHLARRHLPGKHDQKTHGHGKGGKSAAIDAKAIEGDLASGKSVTVHPEDVDDLMEEFSDGPVFNLKHMQVSGPENKNCFKKALREIPRSQMPQLPQSVEEIGFFRAKLAEHGISATLETVDPRSLVATQNELNAQKVAKIFGSIRQSGWNDDNIMFISREGAVLDGHHRWAGASAAAIAGTPVKMKAIRVDTDIDTLLAIANTVSLPKKTLARSIDLSEEPTTPPPDPNEPWIWLDGRWYFVVTDTGDGVPEELNFPEEETPRYEPPGTYDARHLKGKHNQKAHGHDGPAAGGTGRTTVPIRDQNGVVLGSFDFDPSKPMQPQVDAALKKIGMGGAKAKLVREGQGAVRDKLKATPPKPAGMKSAKKTSTKDTTTADEEFPKRKAGTQKVRSTEGGYMTNEELARKTPMEVTAKEQEAMTFYDVPRGGGRGSGANDMNWYLRSGGKTELDGVKFDKKTPVYVEHMKAAISRHQAPQDMMVTRRVGFAGLGIPDGPQFQWGWGESKGSAVPRIKAAKDGALRDIAGHVMQDKGFMSTTLATPAQVDKAIPGFKQIAPIVMKIRVPKGTHMVHLNNAEQEVVFGPNTKMAFTGSTRGANGEWTVDVQIVP